MCGRPPSYRQASRKPRAGSRPNRPKPLAASRGGRSMTTRHSMRSSGRSSLSNETLKADEAAYREAEAIVAEARAGYFPDFNLTGSATRSGSGAGSSGGGRGSGGGSSGGSAMNSFAATAQASLGPGYLGLDPAHGRERHRQRPSQRRRSRHGARLGAGDARHRLCQSCGLPMR